VASDVWITEVAAAQPPIVPPTSPPTVATIKPDDVPLPQEASQAGSGVGPASSATGPSRRQERLALGLYTALAENPETNEDRLVRRVARSERGTVDEVNAAYGVVVFDQAANQRMVTAYNLAHGFDARGNRAR